MIFRWRASAAGQDAYMMPLPCRYAALPDATPCYAALLMFLRQHARCAPRLRCAVAYASFAVMPDAVTIAADTTTVDYCCQRHCCATLTVAADSRHAMMPLPLRQDMLARLRFVCYFALMIFYAAAMPMPRHLMSFSHYATVTMADVSMPFRCFHAALRYAADDATLLRFRCHYFAFSS